MERYRTTLILAGVLIILAAAALFLNNNNSVSNATPTPTPTVYVWKSADSVASIDVVSGTNKVSLKKDTGSGNWSLTQPVSKPADPFSVGSEADALQNLQATFSVTNTSDLAQFGLGPNAMAVTLTFSNTQKSQRSFTVGKAVIDGSGYYVKPSDASAVYVVANTNIEPLRTWLTTPPVETPSPTPLPITQIPLTATPSPSATVTPTAGLATATSIPAPAGPPGPSSSATSTP
jgi:hypothetical protein